jgi:hypothetical protein
MKPSSSLVIAVAVLVLTSPVTAEAFHLNYGWRRGEVRRYRYEETTHLRTQKTPFTVRSVFSERVKATRPNGSADLELAIETLELYAGEHLIVRFDRPPPQASTLSATADRKQHVTLRRTVAVRVGDDGIYMGLRTLGPGPGLAALEPFATIDLKTGELSLMTAAEAAAVRPADQTPTLDVLPRRLFGILVLPDANQVTGKAGQVRGPAGSLRWSVATLEKDVATMRVTTTAASDDARARSSQAAAERERAPLASHTDADVTIRFDRLAGRLLEARGTVIERAATKISSRVILELIAKPGR